MMTRTLSCLLLASLLAACGGTESDVGERNAGLTSVGPIFVLQTLKVMTLNVRRQGSGDPEPWTARLPMLQNMVLYHRPHVIGVQELHVDTLMDFANAIDHNQPGRYVHHWIKRDSGGEGIAIFWDSQRFQLRGMGYKNTKNSERLKKCSWWEGKFRSDKKRRPIQHLILRDLSSQREFMVLNTHFPSKHHCERRGMAKIFADYMTANKGSAERIIALGDFNDGIEADGRLNKSYDELLQHTGLLNAYGKTNPLDATGAFSTSNHWDRENRRGRMIDHILVSDLSPVWTSKVDRSMFVATGHRYDCPNLICSNGRPASQMRLYSDHWAVVATLWP